jgi:hypothetical protein
MIGFAISGKARAGKNTVAEMIVRAMGLAESQYMITALANPMKHIAQVMFPEAEQENLYGASELRSRVIPGNYTDADGNRLTYRRFLLDLGAFGRRYNSDIWLNALVESAKRNKELSAHIVADLRFCNEIGYFKKTGYHMVRILRDDCAKIDDVSETEQDGIPNSEFNTILTNNDSLDDLYCNVQKMVNSLVK